MEQSRGLRGAVPSTLLTIASGALGLGAVIAVAVGWFWARSRGDWQAVALWAYWCGAPLLSGLSIAFARRHRMLRRANWGLLGIWVAVSVFVLVLPFIG